MIAWLMETIMPVVSTSESGSETTILTLMLLLYVNWEAYRSTIVRRWAVVAQLLWLIQTLLVLKRFVHALYAQKDLARAVYRLIALTMMSSTLQ
jgi:hypothetical protein